MISRKLIISEVRDYLALIALGIVMTWTGLSCRNCNENPTLFVIMATFTSLVWIVLWKGNEYIGTSISRRISWISFPLKRFAIGLLVTMVYSLLSVTLLGALWENVFDVNLSLNVYVSVLITVLVSLFMHGREFLLNWRKTSIEAEKYQQESLRAKYESLKSQLSPHFLFNSLNALTNLVYEDPDKAIRFIDQLEIVYKYVLRTKEKSTVPLKEELEFLDAYLFLQEIRFGSKFSVSFQLEDTNCAVAPLALQMLIENAVKHNVISEENPLHIRICSDGKDILVANNLQRRTEYLEPSAKIGLENIKRRYELLNGRVDVSQDEKQFVVKLSCLT